MLTVNVGSKPQANAVRYYCGRGENGLLGNPFDMESESDRNAVCDAFKHYIWDVFSGNEPAEVVDAIATSYGLTVASTWCKPSRKSVISELGRIKRDVVEGKQVELACFCRDKRCHTWTIRDLVNARIAGKI